jgi:hypothetical protein
VRLTGGCDRPTSVAPAVTGLHGQLREGDVTTVAGDAFDAVPEGCATYLLVDVLHDWNDDDARRLLGTITASLSTDRSGPPSRVIVVESSTTGRPRDDLSTVTDQLMLTLTAGGRERTPHEFATLAASVGLTLDRTVHLTSSSDAYVLTPTDAS